MAKSTITQLMDEIRNTTGFRTVVNRRAVNVSRRKCKELGLDPDSFWIENKSQIIFLHRAEKWCAENGFGYDASVNVDDDSDCLIEKHGKISARVRFVKKLDSQTNVPPHLNCEVSEGGILNKVKPERIYKEYGLDRLQDEMTDE